MPVSILVVDDDPVQRRLVSAALARAGHEALSADNGEDALRLLEGPDAGGVSAVILDLAMPGLDGAGVLGAMRERGIRLPVIVQTASGGIETVVSAMRAGAFDFLVKPASPDKLQTALSNALKVHAMETSARSAPSRAPAVGGFKAMLGQSAAMERVARLGRKAAGSTIPVLIEGESGVGKEVVARAIQASGDRKTRPFVTVNCGAIPSSLVESILFGHEKGSFTGATEKHAGKFVEADGGTLFLDEVGDLPPEVQVKLLRAVQSGEVDPVGSRHTVKVDIRLISATHRDLMQRVREGGFREDLYYRLNVFPIQVPPLRERREDIAALVAHFMNDVALERTGRRLRGIAPEALALLQAYDWPGNVRQLENAVCRAVVLCDGDVLTIGDFPQISAQMEGFRVEPQRMAIKAHFEAPVSERPDVARTEPVQPPDAVRALDDRGNVRPLVDVERDMVEFALGRYGGQMSEVARRLGIGRSTLYRKLKEFGLDPDTRRQ
ncbi:MAG: sigma-54-dependent transcriptional regulator [Rhizobiaceae bacterium]